MGALHVYPLCAMPSAVSASRKCYTWNMFNIGNQAGRSGVVRFPCNASNHFHVSAFSISTLAACAVPYVPDSGRSVRDAALFSALLVYHICAVLSTTFFQFSVLHKPQQGSLCIVLFFVAVFLLHALSSTHAATTKSSCNRKRSQDAGEAHALNPQTVENRLRRTHFFQQFGGVGRAEGVLTP